MDGGKRGKKAKSKKPTRGKLVVIDETGTRGHSESYVMTATVVNDRAGFRSIAEVLNPNGEIGSHKGENISPVVLRLSKNMVDKVYGVSIPFDKLGSMNEVDKAMMKDLNSMIMEDYNPEEGFLILVDGKPSYMKKIDVAAILTEGMASDSHTSCIVVDSNYFGEVQTNDFITGAIGRAVNDYRKHPDSSIIERLNGKSDNTLITNLGKNCKEIKLSKCPVNENMTGFVLNNGRHRGRTRSCIMSPDSYTTGRTRSCIMSPSVDTPLKRLNKKIMRHKSRNKRNDAQSSSNERDRGHHRQ